MATKKTPHLDEWMRTIGKVGKGVAHISGEALKGMAPGITETADATSTALSEVKGQLSKAKSTLEQKKSTIKQALGGKDVKNILSGAMNDLKSGTFSFDSMSDDSYDLSDDFDDVMGDMDYSGDDPIAVSMNQSNKNMALLGKAVSTGNAAQIQGMKQMTNVVSNVTLKASKASTMEIRNAVLLNMQQTSGALAGIAGRLDVINQNIVSLVEFQNNTVLQVNKASMEYISESTEIMRNMSKNIAELNDIVTKQSSTELERKDSDSLLGSTGFSVSEYFDMVKKNIKNSDIGTMMGMLGAGKSAMGMMGALGSPLEMIAPEVAGMLIPKKIKNSIARFDKIAMASIDEMLYRLGESDSMFSGILGKKRQNISSINMGNFKKSAMSWNGIAQKTLVEVIPSYLAKIESHLTGNPERYYNMGTGRFITKSKMQKDYAKNVKNTMEFGLYDVNTSLNELRDKGVIKDDDFDNISKVINSSAKRLLTDNMSNRHAEEKKVYDAMKQSLPDNKVNDIMMDFKEAIKSTTNSMINFNKNLEDDVNSSVYRNLFNGTDDKKGFDFNDNYAFISKDALFTESGKNINDMTAEERRQYENDEKLSKFIENKTKAFKDWKNGHFDKKNKKPSKIANLIDRSGNYIYSLANKFDNEDVNDNSNPFTMPDEAIINDEFTESPSISSHTENNIKPDAATSSMSKKTSFLGSSSNGNLDKLVKKISKEKLSDITKKSMKDIESEAKANNRVIEDITEGTSLASINGGEINSDTTMKAIVADMHTNIIKPLGGLLGEKGPLSEDKLDEKMKDVRDKLFDKENGIFKDVTLSKEEFINKIKHAFTGKAYTDKNGKKVEAEKESVLDHITNGYDFLYSNLMNYVTKNKEKDYKKSDLYKKFLHLFDWRSNRDKKWDKKHDNSKSNGGYYDDQSKKYVDSNTVDKQVQKSIARHNVKVNKVSSKGKAETVIEEAAQEAGEKIKSSAAAMVDTVIGNFDDPEVKSNVEKTMASDVQASMKKRSKLYGLTAAGVGGAVFGTLFRAKGTGLIGSLFLPAGPVGGAAVAIGATLLSRNETFQRFMFGEKDENGVRTGGVISNKMLQFVKKNMPLIAGGATLGLIKNLIFGSGGGILGTLFGGPVGGAALSMGIALMKNSDKFNGLLFGKKNKDENGEKLGSKISNAFSKSKKFAKGGLKGLGAGTATGFTISKMGLLGSALGPAGIVGGALAGLGIGIASQGDKFKELLFGTEEFDEEGNSKGRIKNGLFYKLRNMISVKVFEPIKDRLDDEVVKFANWTKKNISWPFRLAFGPIIDSFRDIKQNISDAVHDAFNNVAETVGNVLKSTIKQVFSPLTSVMKMTGNILLKTVTTGTKLALTPLSAALKTISMFTLPKRFRERRAEGWSVATHLGDTLSAVTSSWQDEDQKKFGTGIKGRVNRFLTHGRDLKHGIDQEFADYEKERQFYGDNSLDYMGVRREKKDQRKYMRNWKHNRKMWKNVDAYRRQLQQANDYGEARYNDEELAKIQKRFRKLGLSKEGIANNEDLNKLLYHKDDWKDKFDPNKDKTSKAYTDKHGIKINESPEEKKARDHTYSYQNYMMKKIDEVSKLSSVLAARNSLANRKNIKAGQLKSITKHLSDQGLTWDDVGIDPADLVDSGSISDKEWDKFMVSRFAANDLQGGSKRGFSEVFRSQLEEAVDAIKTGNVIAANNAAVEGNIDKATLEKATGQKFTDKQLSGLKAHLKAQSKIARDAKEAEESKEAQSGGVSFQEEDDEKEESKAKIPGVDDEDENDQKNDTVFDSIKGFFGNILGDITGAASVKTTAALGLTGGISLLFGKQLYSFAETAMDIIGPLFKKAANGIGSWWDKNGNRIIASILNRVGDNAEFLLGNFAKLSMTIIETAAKMAVNKIYEKITGHVYFKDVGSGIGDADKYGQTYDSASEAEENASDDDNVHENSDGTATIMGKYTDVNENGDAEDIGNKKPLWTVAKEIPRFVTSKANRSVLKAGYKAGKGVVKTVGWLSGVIPGFKVVNKAYKLGKSAVNGTKNLGKGIKKVYDASKGKFVKKTATKDSEAIIKKAAEGGYLDKQTGKWVSGETTEKQIKKSIKRHEKKVAGKTTSKIAQNTVENESQAIMKKAAKDTAEDTLQRNATKAATETVSNVVNTAAESEATKKGLKKLLSKIQSKLESVSSKLTKWIPENKWKKAVLAAIKEASDKLMRCDSKLLQKIGTKISEKVGATEAKAATGAATFGISEAIFAVLNGVSGAMGASYLFGVASEDVTVGMRAVSSIVEVLLGTAVGSAVDILLLIIELATGWNGRRWLAKKIYDFVPGSGDALEKATSRLELETQKYNAQNETNLSTDAMNEKLNAHRTLGGRIGQGINWLKTKIGTKKSKAAAKKKYDKKYVDIKNYKVSDKELSDYTAWKKKYGSQYSSNDEAAKAYYTQTVNGPGSKVYSHVFSYGSSDGVLSQSDSRWGNYQLGKFPDGRTSTMTTGGCGPTAMAMALNAYGKGVSPVGVAKYAQANGYIKDGGSTQDLFTQGAKDAGLNAKSLDKNSVKSTLKNNTPILISGKSDSSGSPYTSAGHIVMASGLDSNGNAIVNDPMRGKTSVSVNKLTDGMTNAWSYTKGIGSGSKDVYYGKKDKKKKSASEFVNGKNGMPTNVGSAMLGKKDADPIYNSLPTTSTETVQTSSSSSSDSPSLISRLLSVGYANMSALMGGDYEEAKNKYLSSLTSNSSSDNTDSSSSDLSAANIEGSDVATKAWNYFRSQGYSDAAIAGILGNGQQESGLNPKAGENSGPAHGMWQWESGRFEALKKAASKAGVKWTDPDIQIKYLASELENPAIAYFGKSARYGSNVGHGAAGKTNWEVAGTTMATLDQFKNSTDPDTAARQFEAAVERASWPRMDNRVKYAKGFMNKYGNSGTSYGPGFNIFGRKSRAIGYGGNWLSIVQAVKQAYAQSGTTYHADNSHNFNITINGVTKSVRPDCSGFVSACLMYYGSLNSTISSSAFTTLGSLEGFTKSSWPGWENLQAGDIIALNGHVEIFAQNQNGRHFVYNAGSTNAIRHPSISYSSHSSYTTVWRPNEAGNLDSLAMNSSSTANTSDSTTSSMTAASTPLDGLFDSIEGLSSAFDFDNILGFGPGEKETFKHIRSNSPEAWFTDTLNGKVTSGYGKRNSSLGNEYHRGIDIASRKGTSIVSPIDGTIVSTGNDVAGYGNYAVVRDNSGNNHLFAHMSKAVSYGIGDEINRNDIIGEIGSTGKSTGDHLHYEIRKNGNKYSTIDPSKYEYNKSISRNLNVSKNNTTKESIGSGEKDLTSKEISNKLNVALNTENVEEKLDSLIEVMKTWADRDAKRDKSGNFNQVNNTTITYGNGNHEKTTSRTSSHRRTNKEVDNMTLAQIHKMIAGK